MRPSERTRIVGVAAAAWALAACDALLQLDKYSVVDCSDPSCDATSGQDALADAMGGEAGAIPPDALDGPSSEADAFDATEAGPPLDASDGGDADGPQVSPPTASQLWVHWPMPNPDAAIAPGWDAALPNPMAYDVTADAGYVHDAVTHLTWEPGIGASASSYLAADQYCRNLKLPAATPWRVPTRIELVSLIDFTRTPTFDVDVFGISPEAGPGAGSGAYWTSSLYEPDADALMGQHWAVSFADGLVSTEQAAWVRCVAGGAQ